MFGMLIVGALMYVLLRTFGQYYVDGVGYATVQAVLAGQISDLLAARTARPLQGVGNIDQSRIGLIRWYLFTFVIYGRRPRRRIRAL